MHCSLRLIIQILVFSPSYLHRQESPPETLVLKGGTTWARNGRWILPENAWFPRNIQGNLRHGKNSFTSLPKEGVLRIFFALKNPTASAAFEPANLGTKGQHATSRPPKPSDTDTFLCYISAIGKLIILGEILFRIRSRGGRRSSGVSHIRTLRDCWFLWIGPDDMSILLRPLAPQLCRLLQQRDHNTSTCFYELTYVEVHSKRKFKANAGYPLGQLLFMVTVKWVCRTLYWYIL